MSEPSLQNAPTGLLERAWRWSAARPIAILALLVLAETLASVSRKDLWFADEVRHADVLRNMTERGKWLELTLNGYPYGDKPPGYFWLMAGLGKLTGIDLPELPFVATALSFFGLLAALWWLARQTVPDDRDTAFTAGLVLLTSVMGTMVLHIARMDSAFAALIALSYVCLYKGWRRESFSGWVVAGWTLAGLAVLIKGGLGLGLTAAASIAFLAWRGRLRRLFSLDVVVGLAAGLGIVVAWLATVYLLAGWDYLHELLFRQTLQRAVATFHHPRPWYFYLWAVPALGLPWTIVLIVLPWWRLLRAGFWRDLWRSRREGDEGTAYLWSILLAGLVLLSCLSGKMEIYSVPILTAAAILAARRLRTAPQAARVAVWRLIAAGMILAGVVVPFLGPMVARGLAPLVGAFGVRSKDVQAAGQLVEGLGGLVPTGILSLAAGLGVWLVARRGYRPAMLVTALGSVACAAVIGGAVLPSVNAFMSPKPQALAIQSYLDRGYEAMTFEMFPGAYSVYLDRDIPETELLFPRTIARGRVQLVRDYAVDMLRTHPHVVIAIPEGRYRKLWRQYLPELPIASRQVLELQEHYLLVWDRPADFDWDSLPLSRDPPDESWDSRDDD